MYGNEDLNIVEENSRTMNGFMSRFPKYKELFPNDNIPLLDEFNLQNIKNLAIVVVNKHFRAYGELEELVQVGYLAVLNTLSEGKYDKEKGNIKNYLYTAIRNGCTNYLYRYKNANKEIISDSLPESSAIDSDLKLITLSMVKSFYKSIDPVYHVDVNTFMKYLAHRGLMVSSVSYNEVQQDVDEYKISKTFIKFLKFYSNNL